jgi:hypothetical protein
MAIRTAYLSDELLVHFIISLGPAESLFQESEKYRDDDDCLQRLSKHHQEYWHRKDVDGHVGDGFSGSTTIFGRQQAKVQEKGHHLSSESLVSAGLIRWSGDRPQTKNE